MYLAFVLVLLEEEYYFLAIVLSSGYKKKYTYIYIVIKRATRP